MWVCVGEGGGGLRDYAETIEAWLLLVVGEFVSVVFQHCFLDEGFTPGVTCDEERVEKIHLVDCWGCALTRRKA
jgi:hypothetical protein